MTSEEEERAFLEAQLQWVREREALLAQLEVKLSKMRTIAEEIWSKEWLPYEQRAMQEQFDQSKAEVAYLEKLLWIHYN